MKKIVEFALKTAFGPFVIWCGTALLLFAAYALSPVLGEFGIAMAKMMFVMLLVAAVVNVAAIVISLVSVSLVGVSPNSFLPLPGCSFSSLGFCSRLWHKVS